MNINIWFCIIERVLTATRSNSEALALALDQLSHMLMGTKNLDASLLVSRNHFSVNFNGVKCCVCVCVLSLIHI